MLRLASGATLALTICLMLGTTALAGGKPTAEPAPGTPAAQLPMKASKPRVQPDFYCTHDTTNSKLPACGKDFKQKCKDAGGKLNDPSGNPDVGVCVHDDVW